MKHNQFKILLNHSAVFLVLIISMINLSGCKKDDDTSPVKASFKDKIAFTSDREGIVKIFTMNLDGSDPQQFFNNVGGAAESAIDISRDGTKITFIREGDIYTADAVGLGEVQLTVTGDNYTPKWSPDGSKIAFESFRGGVGKVYVMNADGTGLIDSNMFGYNQKWSPNGSKLCYTSPVFDGYEGFEIFTANADGSNILRLTSNAKRDDDAEWSPDGLNIIFLSARDGNDEIYSMMADGTGVKRLTNNTSDDYRPKYSPNNSKIAFISSRTGSEKLFIMNLDGTEVRQLNDSDTNFAYLRDYKWSPDGTSILFSAHVPEPVGTINYEVLSINVDDSGLINLTANPASDYEPDFGGSQ